MINFNLKYSSTWDNNNKPLNMNEGLIDYPLNIKWYYDNIEHELNRNDIDFIMMIYVSQEFIIVLFSDDSRNHPHPNNIVVYNLKKEIIKIITKPELINKFPNGEQGTMYSIKEPIEFESSIYIPVYIGYSIRDFKNYIETRYLNVETWVFHPTKNEYMEIPNVR